MSAQPKSSHPLRLATRFICWLAEIVGWRVTLTRRCSKSPPVSSYSGRWRWWRPWTDWLGRDWTAQRTLEAAAPPETRVVRNIYITTHWLYTGGNPVHFARFRVSAENEAFSVPSVIVGLRKFAVQAKGLNAHGGWYTVRWKRVHSPCWKRIFLVLRRRELQAWGRVILYTPETGQFEEKSSAK